MAPRLSFDPGQAWAVDELKRWPANIYRVSFVALLLWQGAPVSPAVETAPLACPHCGSWELSSSEPVGAVGERVSIGLDSVSFPTCGEFRSEVSSQSASVDPNGRRVYRTSLTLRPMLTDRLCAASPGDSLRLDVVVSVGYSTDGGLADFSVFKPGETAATLVARGWNFARDNPCDSGSGNGSAACLQIANARLYRSLAQESYGVYAAAPFSKSYSVARQFNPARFAAATLRFCLKREADSGGGSWPYVSGLGCQAKRMQSKLSEFHAWRSCVAAGMKGCAFPDERFDTSASDEVR